ncbi:MAG: amidohydrolase family protein [Acidobacteriota bacterium]
MRIDAHTHIFPPEIVRDRSRYFHEEPAFRLLYDSPKSRLVTAEELIQAMDENGVDRSVTFGFPWRNGDLAARHNDYVLESAARLGPRLIPLGCFDPLSPSGAKEASRCLEGGAAGLGELALYGGCDPGEALKRFDDLIDCCRAHNGLLLVHANEPVGHLYPGKAPLGLDFYYGLAGAARGVPLILAHWGGGLCFFELLKKEAPETLAGVYYDTAASPFLYRPEIYRLMHSALPPGKILFGSDYPLLSPRRYFRDMEEAGLTRTELEAISGGNAAVILKI